MKIYAPVKDFNGLRNNVRFVNGVGETDNQHMIEWFVTHGYIIQGENCLDYLPVLVGKPVEKCEDSARIPQEKCDEPDFNAMTPNELREWAKENGFGSQIKNTRNKDKLLEIIRG